MSDPEILDRGSLAGCAVALSVSGSADLSRLGLLERHCELAVAEIARAVFLAGGTIVFGGRLRPEGFTRTLLHEVRRYADSRHALTLCVPDTEHRKLTDTDLRAFDRSLDTSARLICIGPDGQTWTAAERPPSVTVQMRSTEDSLTAMRDFVTKSTSARVLVGGKLVGFAGRQPGVLEEAHLSLAAHQPIYVAGGFGGAAAALNATLGTDDLAWAPPGFPAGADGVGLAAVLAAIASVRDGEVHDGLTDEERLQLAVTHRPGDLASLVVIGLSRVMAGRERR